jgi:hypothetical protein
MNVGNKIANATTAGVPARGSLMYDLLSLGISVVETSEVTDEALARIYAIANASVKAVRAKRAKQNQPTPSPLLSPQFRTREFAELAKGRAASTVKTLEQRLGMQGPAHRR